MDRTSEELDDIIGYTEGTRGDCLPDDMSPEDWKYVYEAIDVCEMCGHWHDRTEFDERSFCDVCQNDNPIEDE